MKKRFCLILVLVMLVLCLVPTFSACDSTPNGGKNKLVVYNWEDYIDPTLITAFEEYYENVTGNSIKVVYTTYDTNETMMTKLLQGDAKVDLVCPSEYAIEKLMRNGLLQNISKLSTDLLEAYSDYSTLAFDNMVNIDPVFHDRIALEFGEVQLPNETKANMTDYMMPYMMGTLGILYNPEFVTEADLATGWGLLWNKGNNPALNGKILVKDSVRDTYAAAVLYMKEYDLLPEQYKSYTVQDLINCTDNDMLNAVEVVLADERQYISGYEVDFGKDDMISKTAYVDLAWSGDALWAIEEAEAAGITLDYFVPEIGGNVWFDGWCIPTCANNTLAAMMWIDFMNDPENAIWNEMEIGYTSAVDKDVFLANDNSLSAIAEIYEYFEYEDGAVYYYDEDESRKLYNSETDEFPAYVKTQIINDFFSDTRRYPTIDDTLGVMHDFGNANEAAVAMWERAKAGNEIPMVLIWSLVAVAGVIVLAVVAVIVKDKWKFRPRKLKDTTETKTTEK